MKPAASDLVRLDPVPHTYTLANGRVLPSVTETLRSCGILKDHSRTDPWYAERGTAVHEAIKLSWSDALESWDPRIEPYILAARSAIDTLQLEPIFLECSLAGADFAGTIDAVAYSKLYGCLLVIDWKCGAYEPGYRLQVGGGYTQLLLHNLRDDRLAPLTPTEVASARAAVICLTDEATFSLRTFDVVSCIDARFRFREALNIHLWKLQNGVKA